MLDELALGGCPPVWCLRLIAEISPRPGAARVSVIGPVVTGVALVTGAGAVPAR